MPHVVTHATNANDIMCASSMASRPSLDIFDMPEITYWHAIHVSKMTSTKIYSSTFSYLNNENANENVLKRILIAMDNENQADFNDNFKTYSQEPIAHMYKQMTRKGL